MIRKAEMERFSSRMMVLAPRFAMPQRISSQLRRTVSNDLKATATMH